MIRALIFDFDGLIIDTESPDYQSWQEVYREYGAELPLQLWADVIGSGPAASFEPYSYLEERVGRALDREVIRGRHKRREAELIAGERVLPGVETYIAEAQRLGLKLGVASSSPLDWVEGHLTRLGLVDHFEAIRSADDVPRTKPDPALYVTALDALGVRAEEAIALEDSPHGVTAANRAGIYCVAVPNALTGRLSLDHADRVLSSLADLPLEALLSEVSEDGR